MQYLFIFFLCLSALFCKQKDWREETSLPTDWKILHKDLVLKQNSPIQLTDGASSKEEAVTEFLKALKVKDTEKINKYLLSEKDYYEFFAPHTLGLGTSLDTTEINAYRKIVSERRTLGLETISNKIENFNLKSIQITWRDQERVFGPWVGWKPESVTLSQKNETRNISEIKQVVSYKNTWKIAVIAP